MGERDRKKEGGGEGGNVSKGCNLTQAVGVVVRGGDKEGGKGE